MALDQRHDRRAPTCTDQQIAFPMPGEPPVIRFGRPLSDHHHVLDPSASLPLPLGFATRATGPELSGQLAAQLPARLHIQRLINRLVADLHPHIIGVL
jgi:hypothetical protein